MTVKERTSGGIEVRPGEGACDFLLQNLEFFCVGTKHVTPNDIAIVVRNSFAMQ